MRPLLLKIVVALLVLGLVVGAALLLARQQRFEWTTDSRVALEALLEGEEARGKLYRDEAIAHFERALAADPDFAAAQAYLLLSKSRGGGSSAQRMNQLVEALKAQDLEELTPRERALLRFFLANAAQEGVRGRTVLQAYLEEHPDDPFILDLYCMDLALHSPGQQAEAEAEDCLRHLIEVDPNRVRAQNMLAYLAMNRGEFTLAEERFEIYGYLAPDQANPHDSLGELLMVTGRYDEAREELRTAVSLKSDFCPSWMNLVRLEMLQRDFPGARRVLADLRAADGCPSETREHLACRIELWEEAAAERWEALWELTQPEAGLCPEGTLEETHLALRAALETGRLDEARRIREAMEARQPPSGEEYGMLDFLAVHVAALVEEGEGDRKAALDKLQRLDEQVPWGGGMGVLKLLNRLQLAAVLSAAGEDEAAARTMAALARVNRPFATSPPLPPLHPVPPVPPEGAAPAPPAPPPPSASPAPAPSP